MILRRFAHTLLGALAGYLVGAVVGMVAFSAVYGFRSISILEEANRNRWTFIAASGGAVVGGLVAWWRTYSIPPADDADDTVEEAGREAASGDDLVDAAETGDDEVAEDGPSTDRAAADPPADAPRPDQSEASA